MDMLQQIALTKIKGVGPRTARTLLAYCGSAENVFRSGRKELLKIPNIGPQLVEAILGADHLREAEKELAFAEKHRIDLLWMEDEGYPKRLKQCEDAPLLLYFRGTASMNPKHCVSIVGTRSVTAYGKTLTEELVTGLREFDVQIVSGLAYGVDVLAHRQALKQDIPTIGVLGHGMDMIYPAVHRDTAGKMLENGGLLTEFPSETKPERMNFPARNRIIAGLSDVTVVVEAARKGGALITAEIANSYNRDVCAFPGRIDQEFSEGCNYLIKTNRAHLVRNAKDLIYLMGWDREAQPKTGKQLSFLPPQLGGDESAVYDLLKDREQVHIDEIAIQLDWPMSKLAFVLLEMEMNGHILSLPGKVYKVLG